VTRALLLALLGALVAAPAASALPKEYILPGDETFPEGVTVWPGTNQFFVTSTTDGTVFRGTFGRAKPRVFLAPGEHGRGLATGIHATRDRLIVAGSLTNRIFVYALPSGRLIRRFNTGEGGLVNDVTVAPNGDVYATDSNRGLLFRVPAKAVEKRKSGIQAVTPFVEFENTPVGLYSNGLVAVGKRYMLVVGTVSGALVRVDLKTKAVRQVNLHGASLPVGDGLARDGRTLYAVNSISRVTQLKLSKDWLSARVQRQITSPRFRFPTTVAIAGKRLLVVNGQLSQRGRNPVLPFTVAAVKRP
jgi:Cu-Zn family superoxide dismutase